MDVFNAVILQKVVRNFQDAYMFSIKDHSLLLLQVGAEEKWMG